MSTPVSISFTFQHINIFNICINISDLKKTILWITNYLKYILMIAYTAEKSSSTKIEHLIGHLTILCQIVQISMNKCLIKNHHIGSIDLT